MTTESPAVTACRKANGSDSVASGGTLTVLPSHLEGVQVTRAAWRTYASKSEGVRTERLIFSTTLHADRTVAQGEVALLYDAPGPRAVVDNAFVDEGAVQFQLSTTGPFLDAGARRTTTRALDLNARFRIDPTSPLDYCPNTVRVVARDSLALELIPDLRAPATQARLLRATARTDASPLVVLLDTAVIDGPGTTLLVGAALNTSSSSLSDMVIGLIVRSEGAPPHDNSSAAAMDTLEYLVGDVAPHAIVPFAGGWLNEGEHIVRRAAYRAADVHDRPIANESFRHRASEAGREVRIRARRRAECAAWPTNCAK